MLEQSVFIGRDVTCLKKTFRISAHAFICMPGTTKNELNHVQEEFEASLKARKKPLAKHMDMVLMGQIRGENLGHDI